MAGRAFDPHGLMIWNNADYCGKRKNLTTQSNVKLRKAKLHRMCGDTQARLVSCTARCNCYAVHVPDERKCSADIRLSRIIKQLTLVFYAHLQVSIILLHSDVIHECIKKGGTEISDSSGYSLCRNISCHNVIAQLIAIWSKSFHIRLIIRYNSQQRVVIKEDI